MGLSHGTYVPSDGLVLLLDANSRRSTLRGTQSSNILPDPNTWTTGTGGQTGYGVNGSNTEQNRLVVTDDPWGGRSVTWRTTPDSTSGADGGWNSSYYTIDTAYTYRYSVWVRRYTSGTGGTFYMGMNPDPLRNDNNLQQGNPYFTYASQSLLTQNQWYLVVGHVFYEGYNAGTRHPDSGWYEKTADGAVKIADKSYGNVGDQDVRWNSGTTSARHRVYHYYTTNTASGLEFAYPRLDKCDGTEPSIQELVTTGESRWVDLSGNGNHASLTDISITDDPTNSYFNFNDSSSVGLINNSTSLNMTNALSIDAWVWFNNNSNDFIFEKGNVNTQYSLFSHGDDVVFRTYHNGDSGYNSLDITKASLGVSNGQWHHIVGTFDSSVGKKMYIDGVQKGSNTKTGALITRTTGAAVGRFGGTTTGYYFGGRIGRIAVYDKTLTANEVANIFNATRKRFDK